MDNINIENNYKALLSEYENASEFFQRTQLTRPLAQAIENLEQFERTFSECYSLEVLQTLQGEFYSQGLMVI